MVEILQAGTVSAHAYCTTCLLVSYYLAFGRFDQLTTHGRIRSGFDADFLLPATAAKTLRDRSGQPQLSWVSITTGSYDQALLRR